MNILAKRLTHPPITPKVTLYTRRKSRVTSLQKKKQNKTKQKNKKKKGREVLLKREIKNGPDQTSTINDHDELSDTI